MNIPKAYCIDIPENSAIFKIALFMKGQFGIRH